MKILSIKNIIQAGGQTDADNEAPTGLMLGTGTRVVATEKLHQQGNMISTDNALDIAISGDGFFEINYLMVRQLLLGTVRLSFPQKER